MTSPAEQETGQDALMARYKLKKPYFVSYTTEADRHASFRGKAVLEVGGTLPPAYVRDHLGAARWICVNPRAAEFETTWYGDDFASVFDRGDFVARGVDVRDRAYAVIDASIEDVEPEEVGDFDIVFAMATFEHIRRMPAALSRIHSVLRDGGRLMSFHAPLWSSHNGHHLGEPAIGPLTGQPFQIPPWSHLLLSQAQMYDYLRGRTTEEEAAAMVFRMHQSDVINRLFFEDYIEFAKTSPFRQFNCAGYALRQTPPEIADRLNALYPTRANWGYGGQFFDLIR